LPHRKVALVLGCSPKLRDGSTNYFFIFRMDAGAKLIKNGNVDYLLVSGDNRRRDYDEPTAMKEALIARGVAPDRIVCDYAGLTTLDSVVRAKAIFGQAEITIVSQRFHTERAIYLARAYGVDAIGYNATTFRSSRLREPTPASSSPASVPCSMRISCDDSHAIWENPS
jgi:SanA protein